MTGVGAFAALAFNPVAGHFSDRWVSADNRAVMVLIGLVTGGIAHFVLGLQHSMVGIAIWWTLCQATINIAYAPMSAIVVDHVDRRHWGLAWGLVSVAQAVGLIIGLAAIVLVFPSIFGGMTAISVSYVSVPDPAGHRAAPDAEDQLRAAAPGRHFEGPGRVSPRDGRPAGHPRAAGRRARASAWSGSAGS